MNFLSRLITLLFVALFVALGLILIAVALQIIPSQMVSEYVNMVYSDQNTQLILGGIGAFIVLLSLIFMNVTMGNMQREKTIAFENPDGQVVIALSAIEDFIKRAVENIEQVKDIKSSVTATKKGISIGVRLTIFSSGNIPDLTEKIQMMIKSKVQAMLGIEESIMVKVHIAKVITKDVPKNRDRGSDHPSGGEAEHYKGIEYA